MRQILDAEKSIRLRSLVSFSGFTLGDVKEVFEEAERLDEEKLDDLSCTLLSLLDKDVITITEEGLSDQNILFYLAGYAARGISKQTKCQGCLKLLSQPRKEVPPLVFMEEDKVKL